MNRSWQKFENGAEIDSGAHEVSWVQVRAARDNALADSDWRAVSDRTMSQAWIYFRQALRDLPQDFPESANDAADNWPEPPE